MNTTSIHTGAFKVVPLLKGHPVHLIAINHISNLKLKTGNKIIDKNSIIARGCLQGDP